MSTLVMIDAAVPAASPVNMQVGITRSDPLASRSDEMQRPATRSPFTSLGTRHR